MAVTSSLAGQVRRYAAEVSRVASRELEVELRARVGELEQWDYGTAIRQRFDPHWVLHGVEVDGRDDPQLANPEPWPPGAFYYPQDHAGCRCTLRGSRRTVRRTARGQLGWLLESKAPPVRSIRMGSRRVTVTRTGRPAWFDDVVNARAWAEALRRAAGRVRR